VNGDGEVAGGPPIWVIGAEWGPRAALRAELIERGADAAGFETLRDAALAARVPGAARPVAVVVDLHGQAADDRLLDALFAVGAPVVAIGGATEDADPRLRARPWAHWLRRPITLGAIADAAMQIVTQGDLKDPHEIVKRASQISAPRPAKAGRRRRPKAGG
jgi:hypothetical protein